MRGNANWIALAVVVLCLTVWTAYGQIQPGASQAKNPVWEHKIVPIASMTAGEMMLKEMGAQGWELAAVQQNLVPRILPAQGNPQPAEVFYFFKRAK